MNSGIGLFSNVGQSDFGIALNNTLDKMEKVAVIRTAIHEMICQIREQVVHYKVLLNLCKDILEDLG